MTLFLVLALAMALLSGLALWLAAGRAGRATLDREGMNVAIYRERLAELDAERDSGRIDATQHAALLAELQRLLVDDVAAAPAAPARDGRRWLVALPVLVPALSLALYLGTGFDAPVREWLALNTRAAAVLDLPSPLTAEAAAGVGTSLQDAARLTQSLLGRRGSDAERWYQLGMTWVELDAPLLALESLRTARRLAPQRLDILVMLARVELALAQGRLTDEVRALFDEALALDPGNAGVLMVYGMAAIDNGDYEGGIARWQQLLATLDPASEGAGLLRQSIAVAQQRAQAAARSAIRVSVGPALAPGTAPEGAALFVIVRVPGSPMPLAVRKLPAALPVDVTLGDADRMAPGASLAEQGALEVLARLSMSGQPMPASGDLESAPVAVRLPLDAPVTLILDQRRP